MIRHNFFFMRREDGVFPLVTGQHHIHRFGQVFLRNNAAAVLYRAQRRLVDQVGKVCAGRARRGARHGKKIHVIRHHHIFGVHLQNGLAALQIRQFHRDAPVKAARAQQRRVQRFGAVCGRQNDDARGAVKAVHLAQKLVQRLLPLIVAANARAIAFFANGVDLVNKHNARGLFLGLLKQIAHACGALPHKHLHKLAARNGEKRHAGLARHRLCKQRFACARRAHQQGALGHGCANAVIFGGRVQEIHNLAQGFLGLVLPGHICKALARLVFHIQFGARLAHAEHSAAASFLQIAHHPNHGQHQNQRGQHPANQKIHQETIFLRGYFCEFDVFICAQPVHQFGIRKSTGGVIGHLPRGIFGAEDDLLPIFINLDGVYCHALHFAVHHAQKGAVIHLGDIGAMQHWHYKGVQKHHNQQCNGRV